MKKILILSGLAALLIAVIAAGPPFLSVTVDDEGTLLAPTNLFVANSNLMNEAVSATAANAVANSEGFATNLTLFGNTTNLSAVASRAAVFDGDQRLQSSAVTSTELGHLSGVTGGLQTNILARLAQTNGLAQLLTVNSNLVVTDTTHAVDTAEGFDTGLFVDFYGVSFTAGDILEDTAYPIIASATDAVIGLISSDEGSHGSGIDLIGLDGDDNFTNKWSIIRQNHGAAGGLRFSFGDSRRYQDNETNTLFQLGTTAGFEIRGNSPYRLVEKKNADADEKRWVEQFTTSGGYFIQARTDDNLTTSNTFAIFRDGINPTEIRAYPITANTGTNDGAFVVQGGIGAWGGATFGGSVTADSFSGDFTFSDPDGNFTATDLDAAIAELDDVNGGGVNSADGKVEWSQLVGVPAGFADGTDDGAGGSAVILDLADDGSNESTDLSEIAVTGDSNSIFTEPSADKLLIDVGQNWPTADVAAVANSGDSATAFFSSGEIADAQISDTLTVGSGGTVDDGALSANVATLDGAQTFTSKNRFQRTDGVVHDLGNVSGATTMEWSTNITEMTLTANTTLTLTGGEPTSGDEGRLRLRVIQDGTGNFTLSVDGTDVPVDPAANAETLVSVITYDGGTSINLASSYLTAADVNEFPAEIGAAASDETTALTTGTGKVTFRMPYAMTVTEVRASLTTAQSSGSIFTVDINEAGTTILSTKLTIDNTEKTSTTAATAPVISDTALADDAEITVDVDQVGDGTATGLKIWLIGTR